MSVISDCAKARVSSKGRRAQKYDVALYVPTAYSRKKTGRWFGTSSATGRAVEKRNGIRIGLERLQDAQSQRTPESNIILSSMRSQEQKRRIECGLQTWQLGYCVVVLFRIVLVARPQEDHTVDDVQKDRRSEARDERLRVSHVVLQISQADPVGLQQESRHAKRSRWISGVHRLRDDVRLWRRSQ
eukprot:scaffold8557_cov515-Pinguiococcus_pyrenoidosus.AAC.1